MIRRFLMTSLLVAAAGPFALLGTPCAAQEEPAAATTVAATDTFVITVDEALALLNQHSARQVLDEMILEALVLQEAEAAGVPAPDREAVLAEYSDFLREVAATRGIVDEEASLEDIVSAANIEGYFADAGLSIDSVLRRIRVMKLARAILTAGTHIMDDELDAEMPRIRPLVVSPEQRKVGLYVRGEEEEAAQLAAELRDEIAGIIEGLPDEAALQDVLQGRLQPWDQDVFWAAPGPDVDAGPLVTTAFALPAVGSVSDPVSLDERYVVVVVLRIIHATDAVVGADRMTPEELAAARAAVEARVRQAAHQYLLNEKVETMLPDWLIQLRANGDVEMLWEGPG